MTETISISDAESVVMQVVWRKHPVATEDIIAALAKSQSWQAPTIKTLLNRLLRKGALRAERDGRRYLYSPVLTRDEWIATESESLIERLFAGRIAPLVAHFSKHRKLGKKDLADLKRLIEEIDE